MKINRLLSLSLALLAYCSSVFGQNQPSLNQLSLAELMDVKVTVATVQEVSQRETPAVVTLISREQIELSGARDLTEVLRMVPGFEFCNDVQQMVGVLVRGNLASEGKVLLRVDGQEMQDLAFGYTLFGNRFALSHIERIEIIRGAGSAIYGGTAELAVVNIITRNAESLKGVSATGLYSQFGQTFGQRAGSVSAGNTLGKNAEFALHAGYAEANRSDRTRITLFGDTVEMKDNSRLKNLHANGFFRYKSLQIRSVYDDYQGQFRSYGAEIYSQPYYLGHIIWSSEIKYSWKPLVSLTVTPHAVVKYNAPWTARETIQAVDSTYDPVNYSARGLRTTLGGLVSYQPGAGVSILAGADWFRDDIRMVSLSSLPQTWWDGSNRLTFTNLSAFVQGVFKTKFVNLTLGARLDDHSAYGGVVVPRVALTRTFGAKTHIKALYNRAFRAPVAQNINLSAYYNPDTLLPNIRPELTDVFEVEIGHQLTANMVFTLNVFDIRLYRTIVYSYRDTQEGYANAGKSGTRGAEAEFRIKRPWGNLAATYSFYSAMGRNEVSDYTVPGNANALMGAPQHKVTGSATIGLLPQKRLHISPSFVWNGPRYAFTTYDAATATANREALSPVLLLNFYAQCRDFPAKGMTTGLGSYNLLNANYQFPTAYDVFESPLPGAGRDIFLKVTYTLPSKTR